MSQPKPPPPPDYAAANRAGIEADVGTLPFRLSVSQAAQLGKVYTDPETGKTYDFTGLGYQEQNQAAIDSYRQMMEAGAALAAQTSRQQLQDQLSLLPEWNRLNLEQQQAASDMALRASRDYTQNQFEQSLEYQPRFGELQRSENARAFAQNLDLGDVGTRRFAALQEELMPRLNATQLAAQLEATKAGREALRATDPERYALQQRLIKSAQADMDAGAGLSPEQLDYMQQTVRGAQASRGNILGAGAGYDEARMASEMGQNLQQQRRQSALAILQGSDIAPRYAAAAAVNPLMPNFAPSQAINPTVPGYQATTAAAPSLQPMSIGPNNAMAYFDPTAASRGADYAQSVWKTRYEAISNKPNPWMQGLGLAAQTYGTYAGLKAACWVAREVYGEANPRWLAFRHWLLTKAPTQFRALYLRQGERFARLIRPHPKLKQAIRQWMDAIIDQEDAT